MLQSFVFVRRTLDKVNKVAHPIRKKLAIYCSNKFDKVNTICAQNCVEKVVYFFRQGEHIFVLLVG